MKEFNDERNVVLSVDNLTKDFKKGRGVFDINFDLYEGEIFGIIGESGAGKSTILRILMGFLKPTNGASSIKGIDAYKDAMETKEYVSYVLGEFSLFDLKTGTDFLNFMSKLEELDDSNANELIQRFQLDVKAYPKRMSKGMKQKMSIVTAFMKDVPIYLLDEPSIGLDPLMREELINLILEYNKRGKTFLITTNDYEEVRRLCDRVLIISKGKVVDVINIKEMLNSSVSNFEFILPNKNDLSKLNKFNISLINDVVKATIPSKQLGLFFKILSDIEVIDFRIKSFSLEDYVTSKLESSYEGK